jgi:hypothetical protein
MFRVMASLVLIALMVVNSATPVSAQVHTTTYISALNGQGQGRHSNYSFTANFGAIETNQPHPVCAAGARTLLINGVNLVKTPRGADSVGWCGPVAWTQAGAVAGRGLFRWYARTLGNTYYFCETSRAC